MGISSAPEIFQRAMHEMFSGIEGVEIVMDDILVHGGTLEEHNRRLEEVLQRARRLNLKLNPKKTKISQREVDFVGHTLTEDGLKLTKERVEATVNMPEPKSVSELETAMGMISYVYSQP